MNEKRIPVSLRVALVFLLVAGFVIAAALWMQYNELKEKNMAKERELALLSEEVERKREELAAPFDEEYVRRVARRELGYGFPGEIFFPSSFEE